MRVVTVHDARNLPVSIRAGERLFYKPYGDANGLSAFALTHEEMRRLMQRSPAFQRALAGLYQSGTFLFVGASLEDIGEFLQAITPEFDTTTPKHWALVPRNQTNKLRLASLLRFGLSVLEYDPAASEVAIPTFVRRLRNLVRRADPSRAPADRPYCLSYDRIRRVRLQCIGPFEELDLQFGSTEIEPMKAPWSVLYGANGVGKSTILRAIALVLAGDHPAAVLAGARLLRAEAPEGLIEVELGDQVLRTRLTRDLSRVLVTSLQQTPIGSGSALVLGFPALRGARSDDPSGPSLVSEVLDPDPADLVALIGGGVDTRLSNFKQWLVNTLTLAQQRDPRAEMMRNLLDDIIRDIVPGQIEALAPLTGGDFTIRVHTPEGIVPFDDLSQGMSSIFNWIGLLVQRLFSICTTSSHPSDEPAVMLIDEIDGHLHPEWQRRLVSLTRHHFPNVQVIATSHSALLAGSLHRHEIVVLERDASSKKIAQIGQFSDPFGMPSQDILTSGVFGMASDRNLEVERLIREYFVIFQKAGRSASEEGELQKLESKLRSFRFVGNYAPLPPLPTLLEVDIERLGGQILAGGTSA